MLEGRFCTSPRPKPSCCSSFDNYRYINRKVLASFFLYLCVYLSLACVRLQCHFEFFLFLWRTSRFFFVFFLPTDSRPYDGELRLKHILLEASGQIHLHRDVAQVSSYFLFACPVFVLFFVSLLLRFVAMMSARLGRFRSFHRSIFTTVFTTTTRFNGSIWLNSNPAHFF